MLSHSLNSNNSIKVRVTLYGKTDVIDNFNRVFLPFLDEFIDSFGSKF